MPIAPIRTSPERGPLGWSWLKERAVDWNHSPSHVVNKISRARPTCMTLFLTKVLIPIAMAAVVIVLLMGLINMMRGGSPNRSQNLMRMRILMQFIAIVITMTTIWIMGGRQ